MLGDDGRALAKFCMSRVWNKVPERSVPNICKTQRRIVMGNMYAKKPARFVQSFWYNAGVWQIDRQTDRRIALTQGHSMHCTGGNPPCNWNHYNGNVDRITYCLLVIFVWTLIPKRLQGIQCAASVQNAFSQQTNLKWEGINYWSYLFDMFNQRPSEKQKC